MESKKNPRKFTIVLSILLLISTVTIILIWKTGVLSKNTTPATWFGITPGQTTKDDAYIILGIADMITPRGDYVVYRYINPEELGWDIVELWVTNKEGQNIVEAVFRSGVNQDTLDNNLEFYVTRFGKPDDVRWTLFRGQRYIIWSDNGVSARVNARVQPNKAWREYGVFDVLIFEPTDLEGFVSSFKYWPWWGDIFTGWVPNNMYSTGDALDPWPKDPFDWSLLP